MPGRSPILHMQMCKQRQGKSSSRAEHIWHVTEKSFPSAILEIHTQLFYKFSGILYSLCKYPCSFSVHFLKLAFWSWCFVFSFFLIERNQRPKILFHKRKQFHKQDNPLHIHSKKELTRNRSGHYANDHGVLQIIQMLDIPSTAQKYFQRTCRFTLRSDVKGKKMLST